MLYLDCQLTSSRLQVPLCKLFNIALFYFKGLNKIQRILRKKKRKTGGKSNVTSNSKLRSIMHGYFETFTLCNVQNYKIIMPGIIHTMEKFSGGQQS